MSEELKVKRSYAIPENEMVIIKDTNTLLHNIVDSELKEKDKEIERLNNDIKELLKENGNKEKVIKAQENIIKEVREYIKDNGYWGEETEDGNFVSGKLLHDDDITYIEEILDKENK